MEPEIRRTHSLEDTSLDMVKQAQCWGSESTLRKAPCSDCGMRATIQSAPQLLSVEALDLTTSQYNRGNVGATDDKWNNGS